MTRFDADEPVDRRKLFADAVVAHRRRGGDALVAEAERDDGSTVALRFTEKAFEADCTDAELSRLRELLESFPEFRVAGETETETGARVEISARADANRLSSFFERAFTDVYGFDDDYHAWIVAV